MIVSAFLGPVPMPMPRTNGVIVPLLNAHFGGANHAQIDASVSRGMSRSSRVLEHKLYILAQVCSLNHTNRDTTHVKYVWEKECCWDDRSVSAWTYGEESVRCRDGSWSGSLRRS